MDSTERQVVLYFVIQYMNFDTKEVANIGMIVYFAKYGVVDMSHFKDKEKIVRKIRRFFPKSTINVAFLDNVFVWFNRAIEENIDIINDNMKNFQKFRDKIAGKLMNEIQVSCVETRSECAGKNIENICTELLERIMGSCE